MLNILHIIISLPGHLSTQSQALKAFFLSIENNSHSVAVTSSDLHLEINVFETAKNVFLPLKNWMLRLFLNENTRRKLMKNPGSTKMWVVETCVPVTPLIWKKNQVKKISFNWCESQWFKISIYFLKDILTNSLIWLVGKETSQMEKLIPLILDTKN